VQQQAMLVESESRDYMMQTVSVKQQFGLNIVLWLQSILLACFICRIIIGNELLEHKININFLGGETIKILLTFTKCYIKLKCKTQAFCGSNDFKTKMKTSSSLGPYILPSTLFSNSLLLCS
jgi:hypothetical protein